MRIVLLNQYYAPSEAATAQLLTDLAEFLVDAGHDVRVVCSRRSYPDPSTLYPPRETLRGVRVRRTWTTGFGRASRLGRVLDYAGFVLGAGRVLALEREPDVILSLTTPPLVATLGLAAARLRGARSVCWVMDVYPELAFRLGALRRGSLTGRLLDWLADATLRGSDVVVALGETMARELRKSVAGDVAVIHNWADGEAIRPAAPEGNPLRREWGWRDRFVLLYSGNLGLAHEFDTVLDAAGALRGRDELLFAFVGDGPRRAHVEREVERRGLDNVEFRPHVPREQLGHSLSAADVHLVTLRDGLAGLLVPSKIYGILAAGRPTLYVGPPGGEIADILREGRCGERLAVGDSAGLVAAVLALREDDAGRHEAGRRARELFDRRFARATALGAHARVLESLGRDTR